MKKINDYTPKPLFGLIVNNNTFGFLRFSSFLLHTQTYSDNRRPKKYEREKEKHVSLIVSNTSMHSRWNVFVVVVNNYTLAIQARPQMGLSYTTSKSMFECEQCLYTNTKNQKTMETVCGSFLGAPSTDDWKYAQHICKKT